LPGVLKKSVVPGIAGLLPRNERLKRGAASLGEADPLKRLKKIYSYFNSDMKRRLFRGWLKAEVPEYEYGSNRALSDLYSDVDGRDPLTQILYLDTRANLPDDLLMVGDKTSMANSLEARVPFLDFRLVEFAESLPPRLRMRGFTGKYLHKRALEKWLPKKIVYRKKKGFENPIHQWLRTRMRSFVEDALLSRDAGVSEFFEVGYIEEIWRKHQQRSESYMRQIYLLLSFELWHREFMRGGRGSNHATGRSNPAEVATCTA